MATSINSYSVGFGMDASDYIEGARLSRRETSALVKDIEAARTPTENFSREQDRLTNAFAKGAISSETYNRLLKEKRERLLGATDATEDLLSKLTPYGAALGIVGGALAAVTAGGVQFVQFLRDQQNEIDDSIDAANRLGIQYNELNQLRFAFQEGAGLEAGTVDESIKKMQINIAKAIEGDDKIKGAFETLGLEAGDLMKAGPMAAVLKIADAMQDVDNHGERLKLSMEIFGKAGADMASSLAQGSDALRDSVEFQERWNSLTDAQLVAVGSNNDAWDRIGIAVKGTSNIVAAEFAPAMEVLADKVLGTADGFESIKENLVFLVDYTTFWSGIMVDVAELFKAPIDFVTRIGAMDFAGAAATLRGAVSDDNAAAALEALYAKRKEIEEKAADDKLGRELEDQRKLIQAEEDAHIKMWDDIYASQEKKQTDIAAKAADEMAKAYEDAWDEIDKNARDLSRDALKEAEKFFQDQLKKSEEAKKKIAQSPAAMEAGSAEASKFMAQQVNQAIAESVKGDFTWTEEQLLAEAKNQTKILEEQQATQMKMIEAIKESVIKRVR